MNKIYFTLCLLLFGQLSNAQVNNIGIGTTTTEPSAILDLQGTNQGFLLPRMDQSEENVLPSPAQGLMIYNTDINNGIGLSAPRFFNGSLWNTVLGQKSNGEILLDNGGINYFNTTGSGYYQFRTNNTLRMGIFNNGDIQFNRPDLDNSIFIFGGNHITARANDYTVHKDLYLNYDGNGPVRMGAGHLTLGPWGSWRAVFYEDGNVQFTKPGYDNTLLFLNGHHITARSDDWATHKTLYIQNDGGETVFGPSNLYMGFADQRAMFYSDGNVRFRKPGWDQNLLFLNGDHITVKGDDWVTPKTLYIQNDGGETVFGPGNTNFNGLTSVENVMATTFNGQVNFSSILMGYGHYYAPNMPIGQGGDLCIKQDGQLMREASSKRYKKDIRDAEVDFRKILQLKVREYRYREEYDSDGTGAMDLGAIAEEADELGLSYLVYRNKEGQIDAFHYRKMGLYLLPVLQEKAQMIKEQQQEIEDLETQLVEMEKWKQEVEALLSK